MTTIQTRMPQRTQNRWTIVWNFKPVEGKQNIIQSFMRRELIFILRFFLYARLNTIYAYVNAAFGTQQSLTVIR